MSKKILKYLDTVQSTITNDVNQKVHDEGTNLVDYKYKKLKEDVYRSTENIPEILTPELVESFLRVPLIGKREGEKFKVKKRLTVGDLSDCVRKAYYNFKGLERKISYIYPFEEMVLGVGNLIHDTLQKRLKFKSEEVTLKIDDYPIEISGRYDILLNDDVLVEIKSIDAIPKKPKPEHLWQGAIYSMFLNNNLDHNLKTLQLLYVARGKFKVELFNYDLSEKVLNNVKNRVDNYVQLLHESLESDTPPDYGSKYISTNNCFFCPYEYECKKTR